MPNLSEVREQKRLAAEQEKELTRLRETVARMNEKRRVCKIPRTKKHSFRFGVISDLHHGSLYARPDILEALLREFDREKVDRVLCAGDVIEGHGMYAGQEFEIFAHGLDEQIRAAKENTWRGKTPVDFVLGNHDESYKKRAGINVGAALEAALGWRCIGSGSASITVGGARPLTIALQHPGGGSAYAISYRAQKTVESISGGSKPDILLLGHFHKAEMLPSYRNVTVIQAGTTQAQTPFMAGKGLAAHLGGWIVEAEDGESRRIRAEFLAFF